MIDLIFFEESENKDLVKLCDILTKDFDGKIRLSEKLTCSDIYSECYPDNCADMWHEIAEELMCYGGNTFLNLCRHGKGPSYRSIVMDICKKFGVEDANDYDRIETLEFKLLDTLTGCLMSELKEDEADQLMRELTVERTSFKKQGIMAAMLAYGNKSPLRNIGWLVCGAWTVWDIAGPAYRVTVPAVIQVAYMRMKYNAKMEI